MELQWPLILFTTLTACGCGVLGGAGALALKGGLADLKRQVSADTYGGAPLLGVKGACIVGHGSSNATAVKNGVLTSAQLVRERVSELIAQTASA